MIVLCRVEATRLGVRRAWSMYQVLSYHSQLYPCIFSQREPSRSSVDGPRSHLASYHDQTFAVRHAIRCPACSSHRQWAVGQTFRPSQGSLWPSPSSSIYIRPARLRFLEKRRKRRVESRLHLFSSTHHTTTHLPWLRLKTRSASCTPLYLPTQMRRY